MRGEKRTATEVKREATRAPSHLRTPSSPQPTEADKSVLQAIGYSTDGSIFVAIDQLP
jgi:hypothetical protein